MDFFRNDELLPVWNHDDDEYNNQTGIHNNTFENFWSITGNATSEEDNSASDAMFVDGSQDNYNEYSSSSESFSASTEDFPQQQIQYQTQQDQQAQQQFQLEQHQLHIQHQLQQQQLHIQQQLQLQQLQLQQQQQQHLQYQQTQFVPMTYQYVPQQQQYYAVDPSYLQTPNVNTEMVPQQSSSPIEYYQQPQQQISNLSSSSENYEDDVQYDNAYEEDDDYDTPYEEKSTGYGTPSSPASEIPQAAFVGNMDVDSDPVDFKLPASKTPIMEAMVVCALNGWGLTVVKSYANEVVFRVTDFDRYYRVSRAICSKHRPTEDVGSRVKTLRRWFVNFPKKKDRQDTPSFLLSVKPNTCKKVHGIIERNVKLMTGSKRSSR